MSSRKRSRLSWDDCASDDDNHDSDSDFEGDSKGSSARARARKSARKSPATGPATGPVKKVKNKSRKPTAVEQPLHANGSGFSHIGKDAVGLLVQFLSLADFLRLAVGLCKQHGILVPLGDKCKRLRIHKSVAADFFRFFWRTAVVLPSTGRRCESVHPEAKPLIKKFLVDSPTEGTICRLLCCPENDTSQPHLGHGSMLQMSWTKRLALRSRGIASQRKLAKSPSTDLKRMPVAAKMVCVFCTRPLVEWPIQSTRFGGIASWMRDAFKTDNYLHGFPSCGDCLPGNGTQYVSGDAQLGLIETMFGYAFVCARVFHSFVVCACVDWTHSTGNWVI